MNYKDPRVFFDNPPPLKFKKGDIVEIISEKEIKSKYDPDPFVHGGVHGYSRPELNVSYFDSRFCYCGQLARVLEVGGFDDRLTPSRVDEIVSQRGKICPEREIRIRMFKKDPVELQDFYVTEGMIRHIDEGKEIPDKEFGLLF